MTPTNTTTYDKPTKFSFHLLDHYYTNNRRTTNMTNYEIIVIATKIAVATFFLAFVIKCVDGGHPGCNGHGSPSCSGGVNHPLYTGGEPYVNEASKKQMWNSENVFRPKAETYGAGEYNGGKIAEMVYELFEALCIKTHTNF